MTLNRLRSIGKVSAGLDIALDNTVYNMDRYATLSK
jgi:hypothetical protein